LTWFKGIAGTNGLAYTPEHHLNEQKKVLLRIIKIFDLVLKYCRDKRSSLLVQSITKMNKKGYYSDKQSSLLTQSIIYDKEKKHKEL
jgi:hypothetical protein